MECKITKITKKGSVDVNFETLLKAYKKLGETTKEKYGNSIVYDFNSAEEIIKRKKDLVELVNDSGKYFARNKDNLQNFINKFGGEGKNFPIFVDNLRWENTMNKLKELNDDNAVKDLIGTIYNVPKDNLDIKNFIEEQLKLLKIPDIKKDVFSTYIYTFKRKLVGESFRKEFSRNIHKLHHYTNTNKSGFSIEWSKELIDDLKLYYGVDLNSKTVSKKMSKDINDIFRQINELTGENKITEAQLSNSLDKTNYISHTSPTVGTADIIKVEDNGRYSIYDIKVSEEPYENWAVEKKNTVLFEVGTHKALLEYNLKNPNTTTYLINITLIGEIGSNESSFDVKVNEVNSDLNKDNIDKISIETIIKREIGETIFQSDTEGLFTDLKNNLVKVMPFYDIKKQKGDNYDLEEIVKIAKNNPNKFYTNPYFRYFSTQELTPELEFLKEKVIQYDEKNEEEFRNKIKLYLSEVKKIEEKSVTNFISAFKEAKKNKDSKELVYNDNIIRDFNYYIQGTWEIIETIPELSYLGLVLFYNREHQVYDILNISGHRATGYSDMKNNTDYTNRQADAIKALMFLDVYKEHLGIGKLNKIGAINTYYSKDRKLVLEKRSDVLKEYRTLLKNMSSELEPVESNLNSDESSDFVDSVNLQLLYIRSLNNISSSNLNLMLYVSRDNLEKYISEFLDKPGFRQKILDQTLDWGNEQDLLFILLSRAYQAYNNYELSSDTSGVSEYSLNFNNLTTAALQFWDIKTRRYSPSGRANEGIMGGLSTSTPNKQFSKDIRYFNEIINNLNNNIREIEINESNNIRKLTNKYYEYKKYKGSFTGETKHLYSNLYEDLETLKLKDPYTDKTLMTEEREYLKEKLFLINKYFLKLSDEDLNGVDVNNPETFSINKALHERFISGDYFLAPLVRSNYISRHKSLLTNFLEKIKNYSNESLNIITQQNYTAREIKSVEESLKKLEIPDITQSQFTSTDRLSYLQEATKDYFDINLDTIAHAIMDNSVRYSTIKNKLNLVLTYLTDISMRTATSSERELIWTHLINHLKVAGLGQHSVEEEYKDLNTAARVLKRFTSIFMLGFRPALLAKEFTLGVLKGIGLASFKLNTQAPFTVKELMNAYVKLFTIDKNFSAEFHTIDRLNQLYGLANMDTAGFYQRLQKDRHGISKALMNYVFSTSVMGDYFNKLSLFLAMMLKDGSYEAHSIVDDRLVYDPTKDKRFRHYFENRERYKINGQYSVHPTDTLYNDQRALFIFLTEEINKEQDGKNVYSETNLITKAYSQKEKNSFKDFADTAFGFYEKDYQSAILQKWYAPLVMQFKQFWPAKMSQWFGAKTEAGHTNQIMISRKLDEKTGKPLFRKLVGIDKNGLEVFEDVLEDTGIKSFEYKGTPTEGLIFSIGFVLKNLGTLNLKELKEQDWRTKQAGYALWDGLLILLLIKALLAFFGGLKEGSDGISKETFRFAENVSKKMENESLLLNNTILDFSLDPVSTSYLTRTINNFGKALTDDQTFKEFIGRTAGAFEMLRED